MYRFRWQATSAQGGSAGDGTIVGLPRDQRNLAQLSPVLASVRMRAASVAILCAAIVSCTWTPKMSRDHASRAVSDTICPQPNPSPSLTNWIECDAAVSQAWRIVRLLDHAGIVRAVSRPAPVAEGYSVPAWHVTFIDGNFNTSSGCVSGGTLDRYVVVVSAASGRLLGHDDPPAGCSVDRSPRLIPPPYTGRLYTDPAGWTIQIPFGWMAEAVNVSERGISVRGLQIVNPPYASVPPVAKAAGSPAQAQTAGTDYLSVVIAVDDDPALLHVPELTTPLHLDDFAHTNAALPQHPSLDVAWLQRPGGDISVTVSIGAYAIPDDVMLARSMLASLRLTG
jgi:hypothetical protein